MGTFRHPHPTYLYASLIQRTLVNKDPCVGKTIHARIIKSGVHAGVFLTNNLMNLYAKTGFLEDSNRLFNEMPVRNPSSWNTIISAYAKQGRIDYARRLFVEMPEPDSVSWTAMMVGYNRMGHFENAIRMFIDMISSKVMPTQYTFTIVLSSCAAMKVLEIGRKVHSFVVKVGLSSYTSVANSLLNMYAKSGDLLMAEAVFGRMKLKSTSSWNTMISMHMQCRRFDLALAQFEQMNDQDIVTWNSMISGYNQHGFDIEALDMFSNMLKNQTLKPDKYTLASVLSACANLCDLNSGKQIHGHIVRTEFDVYGAVGNALISMYSKLGQVKIAQKIVEKNQFSNLNIIAFTALLDGYIKQGDMNPARQIFDSLRDRDVVAWTAMIVGYMQNGFNNEAMDLFRSMINGGPEPNSYTLAAMLSVSSSLASLDHGKQIHARAIKSEAAPSVSVSNALINMYAKSGSISNAQRVFKLISRLKDTVTWTSMVISFAQHGHGAESLELFEKMLSFDIRPDHITYVGVISACTHMGLVEEGRRYFKLMQEKHGIEPTPSHYACMIDLLGRAGKLQEAWDVIQNMPIEPDVIAWGSLLASSSVHKNMELAKVAAERLLLIEPDNSGAYSALANVYSACGKWDAAAEIRKSMRFRQVKKDQGFSWVQIRNQVHVFGAEDSVHPERDEIYQTMAEIWKEIKKLGFVPKTEAVLHDLDEEMKEQILMHHSEKLAIAFALMKTPKNSTLRIMKNLRVLKWEDVEIGDPKEGEIRVKNKAIGVNFVDIYFRTGVYKVPQLPYTPGVEAAGVVMAVGPGVNDWKIGDAVNLSRSAMGTYTEEQIVLVDKAMRLPPIDPLVVAAVLSKGLTARFLVRSWFKVEKGHTVLIHAAAGGVGSLLCQWANMLGATVIGTVSTKEKALQAKEDGCHHVIIYKEENFVTCVDKITSGGGVDVVFDSVGKDTFEGSLACLKPRGYMVSYGQSSGMPDPVPLSVLAAKSLFLTRPSLRTSGISKDELHEATREVLANVASGALRVRVNHTYLLSQAAQAHADLAGRKTSGSVVLIPDGAEK